MKLQVIILSIIVAATALTISAQRRVNPVNTPATATQHINENKEKGDSIDRSKLVEMKDERGQTILVDTITGREFIDSTRLATDTVPKMIYPLFHSASLSVDFFQAAMRAFGQHYGLVSFAAELNLHNRYMPVFELGLGQAKATPDGNNFSYSSPLSTFFKIGANYNFLYNSNPDYIVMAGLRYGFSPFKWTVSDITQPPGYWDEPISYSIPSISSTAGYIELHFGVRVKIVGNFSLGWNLIYHSLLHESKSPHGQPWYIPGYGSRNGAFSASFSLTYTLPLNGRNIFKKKRIALPSTSAEDIATVGDSVIQSPASEADNQY